MGIKGMTASPGAASGLSNYIIGNFQLWKSTITHRANSRETNLLVRRPVPLLQNIFFTHYQPNLNQILLRIVIEMMYPWTMKLEGAAKQDVPKPYITITLAALKKSMMEQAQLDLKTVLQEATFVDIMNVRSRKPFNKDFQDTA
jgi:hypothetical protein